jgi:hypothetical protein
MTDGHRPYKDIGLIGLILRKAMFEEMQRGYVDQKILPTISSLDAGADLGQASVRNTLKSFSSVVLGNGILGSAVNAAVDTASYVPNKIFGEKNLNMGKFWTNDLVKKVSSFIFEHTAFKVFFGGVGEKAAVKKCVSLANSGIGSIVDLVGKETHQNPTDEIFNATIENYKKSIDICKKVKDKTTNKDAQVSAAFKFTTIASMEDLMQISQALANGDLEGDALKKYNAIKARAEKFFQYAKDNEVEAYADAEHTTINPAINKICTELCAAGLKPTFTVQCYLKGAEDLVDSLLKMDPAPNIKLVRGAYIGAENQPRGDIWATKDETDKCYNDMLEKIYNSGKVGTLTVATHNPESRKKIERFVKDNKNNTKIVFSTLLGMGGNLELAEKELGIQETKYVPVVLLSEKSTYLDRAEAVLGCIAYFGRRAREFMGDLNDGSGKTRADVELEQIDKELSTRGGSKLLGAIADTIKKFSFARLEVVSNILEKNTPLAAHAK